MASPRRDRSSCLLTGVIFLAILHSARPENSERRKRQTTGGSDIQMLKNQITALTKLVQTTASNQQVQIDQLQTSMRDAEAEIAQLNASAKKMADAIDKVVDETIAQDARLIVLESDRDWMKSNLTLLKNEHEAFKARDRSHALMLENNNQNIRRLDRVVTTLSTEQTSQKSKIANHDVLLQTAAEHSFKLGAAQSALEKKTKEASDECKKEGATLRTDLDMLKVSVADLTKSSKSIDPLLQPIRQQVINLWAAQSDTKNKAQDAYNAALQALSRVQQVTGDFNNFKTTIHSPNLKQYSGTNFQKVRVSSLLIKTMYFAKNSATSGLRLTFHGTMYVQNNMGANPCCTRWYFLINDKKCKTPNSVEAIMLKQGSTGINYMLPSSVDAICNENETGKFSGRLSVKLVVSRCENQSTNNNWRNIGICESWTGTEMSTPWNVVLEEVFN